MNDIYIQISCNDKDRDNIKRSNFCNYFKLQILKERQYLAGRFIINPYPETGIDLIIMNNCLDDNLRDSSTFLEHLKVGGYLYINQDQRDQRKPIDFIELLNGKSTGHNADFIHVGYGSSMKQDYKFHNIIIQEHIRLYSAFEHDLNKFDMKIRHISSSNMGSNYDIMEVITENFERSFNLLFPKNINQDTIQLLIRNEQWLPFQLFIQKIVQNEQDENYSKIMSRLVYFNKAYPGQIYNLSVLVREISSDIFAVLDKSILYGTTRLYNNIVNYIPHILEEITSYRESLERQGHGRSEQDHIYDELAYINKEIKLLYDSIPQIDSMITNSPISNKVVIEESLRNLMSDSSSLQSRLDSMFEVISTSKYSQMSKELYKRIDKLQRTIQELHHKLQKIA